MAALIRFAIHRYTGIPRPILSPDVYVKRMSAVGIVSALDIGLSNWSYQFITVLLYTMTKSSSVIFILCFSIMFGLERARPSLAAVITFIASGLFMLTYRSTSFDMVGFLMVLAASLLGGIRWTLAQLVMQKNEYGKRTLSLTARFSHLSSSSDSSLNENVIDFHCRPIDIVLRTSFNISLYDSILL
jgi:solute carrier family 35 protein C2